MVRKYIQPVELYPAYRYDVGDLQAGRRQKLQSVIGGISCGLAGAALGMGAAINGAEYETDIAGIPAQITTNLSTERHLKIKGEVVDPDSPSTDLGWVEFSDITHLPLSVDVQLYADAELVRSLMSSDMSNQINLLASDAYSEGRNAAMFFEKRILAGGLIGSTTAELGLITASRLSRQYRQQSAAKEFLGRSARVAGSMLAVTALAGGSIAATTSGRDWENSFEMHGEAANLITLSGRSDFEKYSDTALGKIINDIEEENACPDSSELDRNNPSDIVVTSYNIKRGDTLGVDAIAEQLRATNSDVIALQEVTDTTLEQLAEKLDMYPIHGWTIEADGFKYGNAVLTNLTMKHAYSYQLPSEEVESRHLLVTVMELEDGSEAVFANTHLTNMSAGVGDDRNKSIRKDQAEEVVKILNYEYYAKHPVVLMGDMNSTPESETHEILSDQLTDVPTAMDIPYPITSPTTGDTIDYIFSKPSRNYPYAELKPAEAILGGEKASDHCSVSSIFEIK